jgi:hypothetical protein
MEGYFFNHELAHFLLTFLVAVILFWRFRDLKLVAACFLTGILIDVDHLFDFWAYSGIELNILKAFSFNFFQQSRKIYVLFHGWEFTPLWWWLGRFLNKRFKLKGFEWALTFPYLGHLFIDQFLSGYTRNLFAYSFIFRLLNNFSLESFNGF